MKRLLLVSAGALALVACAPTSVEMSFEEDGITLPTGDDDAVVTEEFYEGGGWRKDTECRDSLEVTGNGVGDVTDGTALVDQFGDQVDIHDFCGRVVLLVTGAFW